MRVISSIAAGLLLAAIPAAAQVPPNAAATITATHWHGVGERIAGAAPPMRIFEMNLERVGDTSRPGDPVPTHRMGRG